MSKKKYFLLFNFSGAGSKLLQAQLGKSKDLFTLPAYPLIYLPFLFKNWKNNKNLSAIQVFDLIYKHHTSIFDTRKIKGFNGLTNLGKNKKGFLKISKIKFKKNFINYLKNKKISLKNVIEAIHDSYQFSINDKKKNILYHVHAFDTFSNFLSNDFETKKKIATIRHPTYNFWRRAHADDKIDQSRFDKTDYENLKNYRYITRLRDLYLQFIHLNFKTSKNLKLIKFEDIKTKNYQTLQKISKFLGIKFNYPTMNSPSFINKEWFGSTIYKGHSFKKSFISENFNIGRELNLFSNYEIFILEMALLPFLNKFNYNKISKVKNNLISYLIFFILLFLPTKYGLKLFFSRLRFSTIINYIKYAWTESFSSKNQKNYYFNAMYKYKWSYKLAILIKANFIRKLSFELKKNIFINIINFLIKISLYPVLQIELILLYFIKFYYILNIFFTVKEKIKYITKL